MFTNFATLEAGPQAETGCKVLSTSTGLEASKYDISCKPTYYVQQPYIYVPLFFAVVLFISALLFMKKPRAKLKLAMWVSLAIIVVSGPALFLGWHWLTASYYRPQIERAVAKQIAPLKGDLAAMGFKDLTKLSTDCGYPGYPSDKPAPQPGTALACSSKTSRLLTVPFDVTAKSQLIQRAGELDKNLKKQGWRLVSDKSTTTWFEMVASGKAFPPDQTYTKDLGDTACTFSFWTAYSEPDPPALSMVVSCARTLSTHK